jgi:hypothetical protein
MYRANSFSSSGANHTSMHAMQQQPMNTVRHSHDSSTANGDMDTSVTSTNNTDVITSDQHVVYLKSKGYFLTRKVHAREGGRVMTLWNYPLRNRLWSFTTVTFHARTGSFALADERGQVYKMSMSQYLYESVRLASTPVSALCFLVPHKNHLVIAYENSTIVIIDTQTKEIQGNIHLPHTVANSTTVSGTTVAVAKPFARLIRSHPTKELVIVVTNDMTVHLWSLT